MLTSKVLLCIFQAIMTAMFKRPNSFSGLSAGTTTGIIFMGAAF